MYFSRISIKLLAAVFSILFISNIFALQNNDEWETYFEKSGFLETPNYEESMAYFQKLSDYSEQANFITIGVSPQGRDVKCLIVSKDPEFTTIEKIKDSGKPIVLVNNGIHSGEIEGKDACMLLMRDILVTKKKEHLIDNAVLVIIPIHSVDAHERSSKYHRINQNGPTEMGWRTTAQNLNLNRDFVKADAPEMKAFLKLFSDILPDMFIDVHTTNGADYQYTLTYHVEKHGFTHPLIERWVKKNFIPYVDQGVEDDGFLMSPFVGYVDGDVRNGMYDWIALPRFSNGYASIQNRPGVLLETHMLKPYKDRVLGTASFLENIIELVNRDAELILKMNEEVDRDVQTKYGKELKPFPFKFTRTKKHDMYTYKGFKPIEFDSPISGSKVKRYTDIKEEYTIPYFNDDSVTAYVQPPKGYILPAEWKDLLGVCDVHGIEYSKIEKATEFTVERTKFKNVTFATKPYEGRFVPSFEYDKKVETVTVPAGSYYISSDQRTIGVILSLFEPDGIDSFIKWGFFNIIFERKEYYEDYSMEPIARQMLKDDPQLKKEFEEKLKNDEEFKNDPDARLMFFYKRSPYYDQHHNVYPVLRVIDN